MTSTRKSILVILVIVVGISLSESGVVSNESQSVSVSSSITKSKSTEEVKKPSARGGKVLYTAPYSSVRVNNKSEQMKPVSSSSLIPPKFRSLSNGPVLIRKGEEKPTTTSTTTTTTSTTTPVTVILVDLVTEEPVSISSVEEIEADPTTVTPKAA